MREEDIRDNEEKKEGQQTSALLMKGATILVIAGIVSKIFGAIFRIPLTNMIGVGIVLNVYMRHPVKKKRRSEKVRGRA